MSEQNQVLKVQGHLSDLLKLKILNSQYETVFDSIARIASDVCDTPIALISVLDESHQRFLGNVGLHSLTEIPKEISFCQHVNYQNDFFEVADATQDERFWDNPLVTGNPHIRFYCGVPFKLPMGENIGTLCIIDTKPNYLNEAQRKTLAGLAKLAAQILMLRESNVKKSELV